MSRGVEELTIYVTSDKMRFDHQTQAQAHEDELRLQYLTKIWVERHLQTLPNGMRNEVAEAMFAYRDELYTIFRCLIPGGYFEAFDAEMAKLAGEKPKEHFPS